MTEKVSVKILRQLITRLERLSVDSTQAHRAAGLRGSLLDALANIEAGKEPPETLAEWIEQGFDILVQAAADIPGDDEKINLAGKS